METTRPHHFSPTLTICFSFSTSNASGACYEQFMNKNAVSPDSFRLTFHNDTNIYSIKCFENLEIHHLADFETVQALRKPRFSSFLHVEHFILIILHQNMIL